MARSWYAYNGIGDVNIPSSYLYSPSVPTCRSGFALCSIYAVYAGAHPFEISQNLQNYIASGLQNGVPEPAIPAGAKKYVYMKP